MLKPVLKLQTKGLSTLIISFLMLQNTVRSDPDDNPTLELTSSTTDETSDPFMALGEDQPASAPRGRSLSTNEKTLLGKPCDFFAYTSFFQQKGKVDQHGADLVKVLLEEKYLDENAEIQFRDKISQMCIEIEGSKVIDTFKYDCQLVGQPQDKKGVCVCGEYLNMVDPRMTQPEEKPGEMKIYFGVLHLDRKLIQEGTECVSGYNGHCSLPEVNKGGKKPHPNEAKCHSKFQCIIETHPVARIRNRNTREVYGVCKTPKEAREQLNMTSFGPSLTPIIASHFMISISLILLPVIISIQFTKIYKL